MTRTFYVTTPIYYVNAAPHLGHAYTAIAADVMARAARARGDDTFFLTGTDEHGEPIALAAEREGVPPQELADRNAERFRALMPLLGVSNDFFIRTTDEGHITRVQEILQRVHDAGHVYKGIYEGWYCPRCADFKTDQEAGDDGLCPIHRIPLIREREENYFFRLSAFQGQLEQLYAERPDFVLPRHHFNEAQSFIAGGLRDVSLTRGKLGWGIPVPWDPAHVFYVWFDALLNYVTALGYAHEGDDLLERYWPADFHLIGKDILKFHAVYWPALLLAAGLELPRHLFVHGFLLSPHNDGLEKMSKSRGNVVDPFEIVERFGADALRHYLFREVTFGRDGPVSLESFVGRYETELANEYGNLARRTTEMLRRFLDGRVPDVELDKELAAELGSLGDEVAALLDRAELSAALEQIWQRVRRLNRYVEEQAPWQLAADAEQRPQLERVLASLAEGLRVVTVALAPYLPVSTERLLGALGRPQLDDRRFASHGWGGTVSELAPLFPKQL